MYSFGTLVTIKLIVYTIAAVLTPPLRKYEHVYEGWGSKAKGNIFHSQPSFDFI